MLRAIDEGDFDSFAQVVQESVRSSIAESEDDALFLIAEIERSLRDWFAAGANGYGQAFGNDNGVVGFMVGSAPLSLLPHRPCAGGNVV